MRRRGYTLMEIIVASSVLALLVTSLCGLLNGVGSIYLRSSTKSSLQDGGMVSLSMLTTEMRRSAFSLLTIDCGSSSRPPCLAFRTMDPLDPSNMIFTPLPYFVLYFYDDAQRSLKRKTWRASDPVSLSPDPVLLNRRLSPDEVAAICRSSNGSERTIAGEVDALTVSPDHFPAVSEVGTVDVTLRLSRPIDSTTTCVETVRTSVQLRNRL